MSRKNDHVTCNYHYHFMMPGQMPMDFMLGAGQMPEMISPFTDVCPMPEMISPFSDVCPMPDYMHGSHLDGNPHFGAGAFAGTSFFPFFFPFFSPFFFPFFFRRRFFPFF